MAGLTAALPGWIRPTPPRQDPTLPGEAATDRTPTTAAGDADGFDDGGHPGHPSPGPRATRTSTRTTNSSSGDTVDTAVLIAAGLGLTVALAGWAVRVWSKQRLRRPTKEQLRDIAKPLARLAARTWDAAVVDKTLLDVIEAGAATALYLEDGPLLSRDLVVTTGVPDHLQEEEPS